MWTRIGWVEMFLCIDENMDEGRASNVIQPNPASKLIRPILCPDEVAQYNLIEYLIRNQTHRNLRKVATFLGCKDYLDQLWCMKPSRSSRHITNFVHNHIMAGWQQIQDVTTYRAMGSGACRIAWKLRMELPMHGHAL